MNAIVNACVTNVNDIGRSFCAFASGMLIQSTVLIAILFVAHWLLRKRVRATFRYWIWMLVFIKLILPPSLSSPTSLGYWYHDWVAMARPAPLAVVAVPVEKAPPETEPVGWALAHAESSAPVPVRAVSQPPAASPRVTLTGQGVLFLLWLVGVLVLSVLLLQRVCFVRRLIARSTPAGEPLLDLLSRCCDQMHIRQRVGLRLSPATFSPAVCGLFRPVILLPASLLQKLSSDDLRAVLIHELAHLKRGDLWLNSVQTLLQIVYFYNPFIWLANAMTRRVREQAVDEMVLVALGAEAKSYSRTLVDIAEMAFFKANWTLRLIGVAESKKSLEQRIKHILTRPIPKSAKLGLSGVLAVLVAATLLLPMAKGAARRNLQTRPAPVKDTEILVVRWMAVVESNLDKDIRSIAKPVETPSKSYQCLICDANDLIDVIRKGVQAHQVIDIDRNLGWIRPSPEHLMSDGYSHSDNLKHPLYAGYSCGATGPYKLDASGPAAKLDLRYESVSCALNPGPHVEGTIRFVGEVMPGKAVASLGNLKQGDQVKASHLFVWQAIEVPAKLVPYLQAYHSVPDWIQEGPSGILSLARNGLDRNSLLLSPTRASEKWTHTFPDGTQARLVAVFSPRTDPFRFWNPEGQPISGIPEWNDSDVTGKALAAIIERPEYTSVDPNAHETAASDGKYYTNYGWSEATADKPPVFNFPHGYGTWQTVGQLRQGQPLEHGGLTYAIEEVRSQGDGKSLAVTHVKMWYGYDPNAGIRLVAVHKNGKESPMEASEGVIGGSLERGFRSMYYQAAMGLLEKDVDHFNLQPGPVSPASPWNPKMRRARAGPPHWIPAPLIGRRSTACGLRSRARIGRLGWVSRSSSRLCCKTRAARTLRTTTSRKRSWPTRRAP
jgi:beta-lactamase regulating signal transducer with metallopeptidase domain